MIFVDSMGHLITDRDIEELHTFAKKIGLKREWFQEDSGKHNHDVRFPHYDLTTQNKFRQAIRMGANYLADPRDTVRILKERFDYAGRSIEKITGGDGIK